MRRAVFLDRDGVLNRAIIRNGKPYPPATLVELEIFADAAVCLQRLRDAGFLLIVVTNQPDVARGKQSRETVDAINRALLAALPLDEIRVCDHDDGENCDCRKPKPGLLTRAASDLGIDVPASFMVGDRWRDVEAGAAAGCRTIWIDYNYQERGPSHDPQARVGSLRAAVEWILASAETAPTAPEAGKSKCPPPNNLP